MRRYLILLSLSLLTSCAMHRRATQWHGHVGADGKPVFVLSSTYIGMNLGVLLPLLGNTTIDEMVDESTAWIRKNEGTHLRLIETETNNYWYGAPPATWLFSPVISSVTFEYRPTAQALAKARGENGELDVESDDQVARPPR